MLQVLGFVLFQKRTLKTQTISPRETAAFKPIHVVKPVSKTTFQKLVEIVF
jgi:hypothetical protein